MGGHALEHLPAPSAGNRMKIAATLPKSMLKQLRQGVLDGTAEATVAEIVSFTGSADLLRGSRLSSILRGQGRIFDDSSGSAATYELSHAVRKIDTFISHNWCVERRKKFCCLVLHFNFDTAAALTMVVMLALLVGTLLGAVPTVELRLLSPPRRRGVCGKLLCAPFFWLVLHFLRGVSLGGRCRDPIVFLDKTCIHQADLSKQSQGIKKLGAFLCHSSSMLIIYTDVYFRKLWTVYEVASFLALHRASQMKVVPTILPAVILVGLATLYVATVLTTVIEICFGFVYTFRMAMGLCGYPLLIMLRAWARDQAAIQARLATFNVASCTCSDENDRSIVYGNIAALMRATGVVADKTTDEEALLAFDDLVKTELPGAVAASIGPVGFNYKYIFVLSVFANCPYYLDNSAGAAYETNFREAACYTLQLWNLVASVVPLFIAFLAKWAERRLDLAGRSEQGYLLVGMVLQLAGATGAVMAWERMTPWALTCNAALVVLVAGSLLLCAATYGIFCGVRWPCGPTPVEPSAAAALGKPPEAETEVYSL